MTTASGNKCRKNGRFVRTKKEDIRTIKGEQRKKEKITGQMKRPLRRDNK